MLFSCRRYLRSIYVLLACLMPLQAVAATALNFTVTTSKTVTVDTTGGVPRLILNVGGLTRYATYASGSGTTALTFTYTAQPGDLDLDGITVSSPLDLNGGAVTDTSGNALSPLTFTAPSTANVRVDHPSVEMDFIGNSYLLGTARYSSLAAFLSAAGGAFSRASIATYFDSSGNLQTAPTDQPRFTYDPVSLAAKGLLMEETRTNTISNSTFSGLSAQTYTTNTTVANWAIGIPGGLTGQSMTITPGTTKGMNYLDIRFTAANPTGSTLYPYIAPATSSNATVSNGVRTSVSFWAGITSFTGTGCNVDFQNRSLTGAGAFITNTSLQFTTVQPFAYRTVTPLLHGATAGQASFLAQFTMFSGGNCDITIRLAAPQLEIGAFPTSFIPTTSAPVTRATEFLSFPTGSWFNPTASTLMASGQTIGVNSGSTFADINNNNFTERFQLRIQGGPQYGGVITAGNVVQGNLTSGTYPLGQTKKSALAAQLNDAVLYADGTNRGTDTSIIMPTPTRLRIGAFGAGGGESLNGNLGLIRYYPVRIANSQLQMLTQ